MSSPGQSDAETATASEFATLLAEQRAEIGELRAELAALRQRAGDGVDQPTTHTSRRSLLRSAGIAGAIGAMAATGLDHGRAAAADGGPIVLGNENNVSSNPTRINASGAATALTANVFTASTSGSGSVNPSAIGGFAFGSRGIHNGVYGFTNSRTNATNTGHALIARAIGSARSHLYMDGGVSDPTADAVEHERGEMRAQTNGDLWWCAATGTPGTWRKIAGAAVKTGDELDATLTALQATVANLKATVSTLELVTPFRVYDSRLDMAPAESGALPIGASRVIPVRDARNVESGAVATPNAVPAGATGVVYTISIIAPVGTGFLTVVPSEATTITAATINFDATSPTVLNNTSTVKLGGDREIRIIAGGVLGGNCNFVIDVVGYHRPVTVAVA